MLQPTRLISTPFAQEGEKTQIQNATGEFDNSATYRLGFPPLTMQSIRLGGKPPKGTDFNGVLFDITENISFLCKGGRYQYNAGLSTLIGGYPEGSNLLLDDNVTEVVSTVADNQNNPNINMTGWTLKPNKTTAVNVADASGETQQQVNYNGGSKWHSRDSGYLENERVVLANGDIVKSTVDSNTNDPNSDMTGWAYPSLTPSNNLSDVADKASARTNLGVYSKAETDSIAGTPNATETVAGKAKIATTTIAQEGVNDTDFLTPKKLRSALNALGDAPVYACRAWVNFNGTGTVSIRSSGNVSSITDNGAGSHTINFINRMPDNNYAVSYSASSAGSGGQLAIRLLDLSTNSVNVLQTVLSGINSHPPSDVEIATVAIFR